MAGTKSKSSRGTKTATTKDAIKKVKSANGETVKVVGATPASHDEPAKQPRKRPVKSNDDSNNIAPAAKKNKLDKASNATTKSLDVNSSVTDNHVIEAKNTGSRKTEVEPAEPTEPTKGRKNKPTKQDKVDPTDAQKGKSAPATAEKTVKPRKAQKTKQEEASTGDAIDDVAAKKPRAKPVPKMPVETSIQRAAENLLDAANDHAVSAAKKAEAAVTSKPIDPVSSKGRKRKATDDLATDTETTATAMEPTKSSVAATSSAPVPSKRQRGAQSTARSFATSIKDSVTSILNTVSDAVGGKSIADDIAGKADDLADALDEEDEWEPDDQTANLIKGFQSDEEDQDSGDEGFKDGKKIPGLPKKRYLTKKLKAASAEESGAIYVGRVPHGFHEHEMRSYFSQFGAVNHVRLSRSKKTGRSKHYAFLEFASAEVAKIAAETMNNYLLFGHVLKCSFIPKEQVHPKLWVGADRRFKSVPWARIEGHKLSQPQARAVWDKKVKTEKKRREEKAKKVKEVMNYEVALPELKGTEAVPVKEGKLAARKALDANREKGKQKKVEAPNEEKKVRDTTIAVAEQEGAGAVAVSEDLTIKKGGRAKKVAPEDKSDKLAEESGAGKVVKERPIKMAAVGKTKKQAEDKEKQVGGEVGKSTPENFPATKKPRAKKSKATGDTPSKQPEKETPDTAFQKTSATTPKSDKAAEEVEASKVKEIPEPEIAGGGEATANSPPKRTPKPTKRALEMQEFKESVKRLRKAKK